MALDNTAVPTFIDNIRHAFRAGDPEFGNKGIENDNVKILQDMMKTIAGGDWAAFAAFLDDDCELEILGPPNVPFVGRSRGKQQVAQTVSRNFALVEEQTPEVVSCVAQGDTVVLVGRERGKVKETKQEYDYHWVQFHTFKDGKSIRVQELIVAPLPK